MDGTTMKKSWSKGFHPRLHWIHLLVSHPTLPFGKTVTHCDRTGPPVPPPVTRQAEAVGGRSGRVRLWPGGAGRAGRGRSDAEVEGTGSKMLKDSCLEFIGMCVCVFFC